MTDAEISKRLALAIGWVSAVESACHPHAVVPYFADGGLRVFDYRDPAVIWPIAERFNCFPVRCNDGEWITDTDYKGQNTAAKAIALAIIKAKEQQ